MELIVKGLRKAYDGRPVLTDVSFRAGPGVLCLMAPSGVGKTTLLRILLGLEKADGGSISGTEGCRWAAVFQEDRLLEQLDALGNLRFALGKGFDSAAAKRLLEELGLEPEDRKPVREYSGGMKRRLALARALLAESDALALDEPFTGLDRESRQRALECIRRWTAGKPVLLVTHDESDAAALGAAVYPLKQA